MNNLFYDAENKLYTIDDIKKSLVETGAAECETLFIHSDIMFGRPAEGFKRKEYIQSLYEVIEGLGVRYLIVPTFTYSFCNNESYDVVKSKTSMGAFNEFVRKMDNRYRTIDPLLSVSVPLELEYLFKDVSEHSLGEISAFDILHHMNEVKFLFFGAEMADCFTFVHYVEKMMDVPYRFDMPFEGEVILPDGTAVHRRQVIHTQCYGVKLPPKYDYFEKEMEEKNFLKKKWIGEKYVACISEKDAYREIKQHIEKDINYYLEIPFKESDLIRQYTYSTNNGRITHC